MTRDELKKYAETEAEDAFRYLGTHPELSIKQTVAEKIESAYWEGYRDGKNEK